MNNSARTRHKRQKQEVQSLDHVTNRETPRVHHVLSTLLSTTFQLFCTIVFGRLESIAYLGMSTPAPEEVGDFLLSCRYGEVNEVKLFAEQYGWEVIAAARDDRGNTALHMCCGNGHTGEPTAAVINTLRSL